MGTIARRAALFTGALALAAAAVGASVTPANASLPGGATITKPLSTHIHVLPRLTKDEAPVIGALPLGVGVPLQYGGGPVELSNTAYAIFWEPTTGPQVNAGYNGLISRYFQDIGGSALFGTTTQYYQTTNGPQQNITNVSSFGGSYVDTTPYPNGNLTDADIQAEVVRALAAKGWTGGVGHQFFVYTNPGAITLTNFCAYHGSFTHAGTDVLYANLLYGNQVGCQPPSSPNGNPEADGVIDATSHEHWETITDPIVGYGWTAVTGDEGSDQCNHTYGPTDANGADVTLKGHPYILQLEWSNQPLLVGCVMS
ncbi:MAG: hypothetical protein M3N21_04730 [Actinomycetota bacterium]|nr:hypothetical protein [Actinomycetota bacterium]